VKFQNGKKSLRLEADHGSAGVINQGAGNVQLYSLGSILLGQSRIMTTFGAGYAGLFGTDDEWVERWGLPPSPLLWSHAMFLDLDLALALDG